MPEPFLFLIQLLFVVIGIGGIAHALYSAVMSILATSWKHKSGTIEYHSLEENGDSDGDTFYEAKVKYSYQFRNKYYSGNRIGFGFSSWNIKWIVASAYNESVLLAPSVTVFVNPNKPSVSTVLTGLKAFHFLNILFFSIWNILLFSIFDSWHN